MDTPFPFFSDVKLDKEQIAFVWSAVDRLEKHEPLQYILGKAPFLDIELKVNPSVLIPRPETEELVFWALAEKDQERKSVLDLCTGSGCIALSLKKKGKWEKVSGLDVSNDALNLCKENASDLNLDIEWFHKDLLLNHVEIPGKWDVWISNPPYVLRTEASEMSENVLKFEPEIALFVPDRDPLLFYKIIIQLAKKGLNPGGVLFFEINPKMSDLLKSLLESEGFKNIEIKKDIFEKERMIRAEISAF